MSDMTLLRIGIAVAMSLLLGAIIFFGRSRTGGQGRRVPREAARDAATRQAPGMGEPAGSDWNDDNATQDELPLGTGVSQDELGRRPVEQFDRIIALYVAAKSGCVLRGTDIVVAAEKAGLAFGYMGVFHRLVDGRPEVGPIFSVANIIKPGSFDMARIGELETPAIAFFLTLPAPIPALDAWETMEPAAQRMASLLDGVVLDEERNALGRQRIQHIREELRSYDRQATVAPLGKGARW
ncbi:cell division protein ZipA [Thermomonas paludicola]|uniref:cell division protein ZipA n=1 Tax=Thermomonas paludicola TaxID=2884874 RepID=UPI002114B40F|nr:cell division protein ZipA [Thermomonas paludicola]